MVTTSKTVRSASIMAQIPCFSLFLLVSSRDRIAPDCAIRQSVWSIVALQRRVRFSARLAGFAGVGVTRDALEGLNWPHFRFWSLISIFECHVCAKGGSGPLTGPCNVGKEATRGVQNRGQGYRGVAGTRTLRRAGRWRYRRRSQRPTTTLAEG